ncbi:unnamed protein product [Pylaiella littoralis]
MSAAVDTTTADPPQALVSQHPVLQHKLALIRRQEGTAKDFRTLFREITFYLGYEATATLTTKSICVKTDRTDKCPAKTISETVAVVPILRQGLTAFRSLSQGGLGMTEALLELLPDSPVYHVGMYRNPGSNIPVQYYNRLPKGHPSDVALILDPVIASSRTINAVVSIVKKWGAKTIKVVTLVASRCGLEALYKMHPEVEVHLASIDELASNGLDLVPGIGDCGDRLYLGTNAIGDIPSTDNVVTTKKSKLSHV